MPQQKTNPNTWKDEKNVRNKFLGSFFSLTKLEMRGWYYIYIYIYLYLLSYWDIELVKAEFQVRLSPFFFPLLIWESLSLINISRHTCIILFQKLSCRRTAPAPKQKIDMPSHRTRTQTRIRTRASQSTIESIKDILCSENFRTNGLVTDSKTTLKWD